MKKETITYDDFAKLDIRVGKVLKAEEKQGSDKLLRLTVDFGSDYGTVIILSGIKAWYTPADIQGKKFFFLANLAPRKMMGEESCGMILAVDGEKPILPKLGRAKKGAAVR